MRILFYQPYNQIVVYVESVVEQFAREGHDMFFVSHAERGETHTNLEKLGCKTFSLPVVRKSFIQYYWDRVCGLSRFCKQHHIDVVYSHFQEANLIAVIAQYFCSSKFIISRHHSDCAFLDNNWKERWGDKIINRLARNYIATSQKVWNQTVEVEKTNSAKVILINYGYNFESFQKVNISEVHQIKSRYPAKILLVAAARFIPEKRHDQLIAATRRLIDHGYDIKLLLLGKGPLQSAIENQIAALGMNNRVFVVGFKLNIMDFFAASDLVVHFSLSEASNSAIKEAAITDTTVAVCNDVGDFDDYIRDGVNGIVLDKRDPGSSLIKAFEKIANGTFDLAKMGKQLHEDVVNRFDIKNVIQQYQALNNFNAR